MGKGAGGNGWETGVRVTCMRFLGGKQLTEVAGIICGNGRPGRRDGCCGRLFLAR